MNRSTATSDSAVDHRPAVGYIRVSTERQASEGVSLEAQRAKISAWCVVSDLSLDAVYVDAGLSGGRADNRPELQLALTRVCELSGALIVYSMTRLSRSTRDTIEIAERLSKAGADLVSLTEKIDTSSAAGRMVFRVLAVIAEFERDLGSERTSSALQYKRSKFERVGKIPFGYLLQPDGKHLIEYPAEQLIIARILELRGAGQSYRGICRALTEAGLKPKQSAVWHAKVISDLCHRKPIARLTAPLADAGSHTAPEK